MRATSVFSSKLIASIALALLALPALGIVVPERDPVMTDKEFRHPDLHIPNVYLPATALPETAAAMRADLQTLGVAEGSAFVDERTARWGTLLPTTPLLPGDGKGNALTWAALGSVEPLSRDELRPIAWNAFRGWVEANAAPLGIDPSELPSPARLELSQRDLVQIHVPRVVGGITVRDSFLTAVISHGNLVLFGARNWAEVTVPTAPTISIDQAEAVMLEHLEGREITEVVEQPELYLVPVQRGSFLGTPVFGEGLGYRLVWALTVSVVDDLGKWESLVDAHTGELIAFQDTNHYATARSVVGGVLPASNDGMPPDGVEQPEWPMPFVEVTTQSGETLLTDAGGNLPVCVDGGITTTLEGPFLVMDDNCGDISESSPGDIDLGISGGTDCTVPNGASPGNTHSSRSGFYEMNRIIGQAKGQLPDNEWLFEQLTSEMNISSSCNAFWDGEVNFFRSGGGCANTGELAGVFDHEWGHGMDDNGVNSNISSPGEGIPDIYAALRLNDSCIGRGFFLSGNCGGYGDPCIDCSGIRNIDFAKRVSGQPHGIDFAIDNCGNGPGPCGGIVHCEGALYAEAVWDLFNRDLPQQGVDFNKALELATRLTYQGANPVGSWYACDAGQRTGDGCNADGGYLNFLAADDDNGDLNDGTPHMVALNAAFARHDISCPFLPPVDSGCDGGPVDAPTLTSLAIDRGAELTWTPVAGAERYELFRADGVFGCAFGKEKVADTTELSFLDQELANGREYCYTVAAIGPSASCLGPMSNESTVVPVTGPNLVVAAASGELTLVSGDGDEFIDNCEEATLGFTVSNIGSGSLTNVEIVAVEALDHPDFILTTPLPIRIADSLASCDEASGLFGFLGQGIEFSDRVTLRVSVTADELDGVAKRAEFSFGDAESDLTLFASRTYELEDSAEGWKVEEGTFTLENQPGGGAGGSDGFFASSSLVPEACDEIRSPLVILSETSTMTLSTNFDIQERQFGNWFDRANIGLVDAGGERVSLVPDGGRLYNADGPFADCGLRDEPGYADSMPTWEESQWSSEALQAGDFAGERVRLSVTYTTNNSNTGTGFLFDRVTLTDATLQVEDEQSNVCEANVAPEVTFAGSCPGSITLMVGNGTPGGAVRIYGSDAVGTTVVEQGECLGVELDLDQAQLVARATFDMNGEITSVRPATDAQCGLFLQAVDVSTCTPSDRAQVPE